MQFYSKEDKEEYNEQRDSIKRCAKLLRDAAAELNSVIKDASDVENMSNDAYSVVEGLVQELNRNYDINSML